MTNWSPTISKGTGPLYLRLANHIEADISDGVLSSGTKLPPQRDLAYDLGVTIGTVGRAYALLRQRGLVSGEVGRGTYVLDRGGAQRAGVAISVPSDDTRGSGAPSDRLRFDSTAAPDVGQGAAIGRILADISSEHPGEMSSYARAFPQSWLEAGSQWLARNGFNPAAETVVPTLGAHAALVAIASVATVPGDHIVFENLSYSQFARSVGLFGRRVALVDSDDQGVVPGDFERLCAQRHPKLAFLMPTVQNPTVVSMPQSRRREIAEIARRHNVWLIEDDLYGAPAGDPTPLLAEFAPERTFVVAGLSKAVAAGVRGGWVACPPHFAHRIAVAHKMATGGMPFLLAELCARLVLSGEATAIRARCLDEVNARLKLACTSLAGFDFRWMPNVPFLWLGLPEPWLSGTFKNAAAGEGVLVDDEDEFKAGRTDQVFHRIRVGITTPRSRADVSEGLATIRRLLASGGSSYDSYG
ncbi:MAG TPA: PLP-dependent aminotransferase family protein [Rhizobiaceae bacterium]|nr:PLP-dependent aminotransferase family protein [Rhizobiaceae bacterium]